MLLAVLVSGINAAWGEDEVFYTLTPATGTNNGYASSCDVTISDITWNVTGNATLTPWRIGGKSLSKVDRTVFSKTALGSAITKVELKVGAASSITVNSLKLIVASDNAFSDVIDEVTKSFSANSTITFTPSSPATNWESGAYYKFVFNVSVSGSSNKFVEFSEAKFYKESGGGSSCATPTFDPAAGAVAYGTSVAISSSTDGATIYYTTNGTTPTTSSSVYSSALTINANQTIKAIAVKDGLENSSVGSASYTIAAPAAPEIGVPAGTIAAGTEVSITGTGTIRYTTDGTNPTSSTGTIYSEPISIDESCTLKAICVDGGGNESAIASASYTVFTPVAGYAIDFESAPAAYVNWTMTNVEKATSAIKAHGGSFYGNTDGKATASIVTKSKVAYPETIDFYISKESTNTSACTWVVEVSSDGSAWTQVGDAQSASSMSKGDWVKVTREIKDANDIYYTDVYIRIKYGSSTAIRAIDDITLTESDPSKVKTPKISVASGTYNEAQSVELTCNTDGATIYYTTNGDTPTSSSTPYSSAITVNASQTIKAIAVKGGLTDSDIASATYTLKCATPTISVPSGAFVSSKVITITSTDGATIRYTTDGSTVPSSTEGDIYDSENKPSISATTTVKAIAYKDGWSNSEVQTTTFTKETVLEGISALNGATTNTNTARYVNLTNAQVTWTGTGNIGYLNDASAGIYIYGVSMTLNTKYNGVWRITTKTYNNLPEITAFAEVTGEGTSEVVDAMAPIVMTPSALDEAFIDNLGRQIQITGYEVPEGKALTENIDLYGTSPYTDVTEGKIYTLIGYPFIYNTTKTFRVTQAIEKPTAPTFDPAEGEFSKAFELTMSAADGATIYYTTNGDTPTESSSVYNPSSKPTVSTGADVTVKAIAVLAGMTSDVASATYEYKAVSQPVFDPVGGTELVYGETVSITCDVDAATIYYTTDGSTPTDGSSVYSTPIAITSNLTLKAIAKKGANVSDVASADYTVRAATPTFSVAEGTYNEAQSVTLSCTTPGVIIYYTTNGDTPTSSSTEYTSAITVNTTGTTIKAIAIKAGLTDSEIASATYTLKALAPTFSVAAGDYDETQSVELACETEGAKIYYTLDGSTPTASSTLYSSAISISSVKTIKAIAVKSGYADSDVASAEYRVVVPASLPFSYNSGYSNIASTTGLTQSGIDKSDYVTTNTKLKFNDTEDYLILKFAGVPNVLSFNIKGNGFSGGTFKVQYSDDGSSYTDLEVYDELGASELEESFNNIPASARYIKWIYTKKSSGNVGLGNISLNECEPITIGGAGYTTHVTSHKVSLPDGVTAYIATATGASTVTLSTIEKVPASTAIILKADAGSYKLPVITTDADDASANILQASDGSVIGDGSTIFALGVGKSGVNKGVVGFYLVINGETIPAGKAYLTVPASVKEFLTFVFDDATAIAKIQDSGSKIQDSEIFNLAGQKMSKLQKGVNIVNGKKVLVK